MNSSTWDLLLGLSTSAISGAALGCLFSILWNRICPASTHRAFIRKSSHELAGMLDGNVDDFWAHYRSLVSAALPYVALQVLALTLASVPILLFVGVIFPELPDAPAISSTGAHWVFWATLATASLGMFVVIGREIVPDQSNGIDALDWLLARLATRSGAALRLVGNFETRLFRRRLSQGSITSPVFVAGLPRAGTTIVWELLARAQGAVTHRHRDFPFVPTPIFWAAFTAVFARRRPPRERAHADGIWIDRESPEALEEVIWQHFCPRSQSDPRGKRLRAEDRNAAFEQFFRSHILKLLWLRRGDRYLSKNNYNVARIELLSEMFPDARFVIPVRHPLVQIESLVRQHRHFCDLAKTDPRVGELLAAAGHYEFGPQRQPIQITAHSGPSAQWAFDRGLDALGYARQWADTYGHVLHLRGTNSDILQRIHLVRYEDLCMEPRATLARLSSFLAFESRWLEAEAAQHISASPHHGSTLDVDTKARCWAEVAEVAVTFGYQEASSRFPVRSPEVDVASCDGGERRQPRTDRGP